MSRDTLTEVPPKGPTDLFEPSLSPMGIFTLKHKNHIK